MTWIALTIGFLCVVLVIAEIKASAVRAFDRAVRRAATINHNLNMDKQQENNGEAS